MPPNQDSRLVFTLLILLLWVANSPDNSPGFVAAPSLTRARLARQRNSHAVLNSTKWGDFSPHLAHETPGIPARYLNLTGFRENDGFAWDDLGRFRDRCDDWARNAVGGNSVSEPVWQNVTGVVRGPWIKRAAPVTRHHSSYNLSAITPDVAWVGWNAEWGRNITGSEGKMMVRVDEQQETNVRPDEITVKEKLWPATSRPREVSATVTIDDVDGTGSSFDMRLHGVHWPQKGALLLTTTSEKFAGIFGLPHLTSKPEYFDTSQALLNRTLDDMLRKKEKRYFHDHVNPWAADLESPTEVLAPSPHCEYVMYMQVHPLEKEILKLQPTPPSPENVVQAIEEIENELRFPQGAPHQSRPKLQMSTVVYSPDCGFMLETKGPPAYPVADGQHLMGWKQEFWLHGAKTWLIGFAVIIFCQVQLLKMQMRETSTPSTLGRISFFTAAMMLLADGVVFIASAAWTLSAVTTMLPSLVVTGAAFLSMTLAVLFLGEIYKVQEPEWRRQDRERQANSANTPRAPPAPATVAAVAPVAAPAPAPAPPPPSAPPSAPPRNRPEAETPGVPNTLLSTAARRANLPLTPPIIIPSDQDIGAEIEEWGNNTRPLLPVPVTAATPAPTPNTGPPLSSIFGRIIMLAIALLFLSLAAMSWRPHLRSVYFNVLAFFYLSLWSPQIYRNIYRNCRRALSWHFVIGQSVLRLLPISYFYLLEDNFAFAMQDWTAFAVLAGWVWVQIWILVAQSVLGPRFGIPKGWMPEAWEYHPVLREDNIESGGLPIGLVNSSAPSSPTYERRGSGDTNKTAATKLHVIDCAICREVLEVPVVKAGESDPTAGGVAGVFARRAYMVTPCRHIFHSQCLEGWMRFRLQCPICREELPPL